VKYQPETTVRRDKQDMSIPVRPAFNEDRCGVCGAFVLRGSIEHRNTEARCGNCRELRVCMALGIRSPQRIGGETVVTIIKVDM